MPFISQNEPSAAQALQVLDAFVLARSIDPQSATSHVVWLFLDIGTPFRGALIKGPYYLESVAGPLIFGNLHVGT